MKYPLITVLLLCLFACEGDTAMEKAACYQLPVGTHLPRFSSTDKGVLLSYVSSNKQSDTLHATSAKNPFEVSTPPYAIGENWFINWADFPSVVYFKKKNGSKSIFAHWLQYSGKGTYDYDIIHYSGWPGNFTEIQKLHTDTVSAEHGFLSSAALPQGGLQVTWLDGRYTKQGAAAGASDGHGHGHGGGAMTLRTKALSDSTSIELDHRVCDCCNTATVATDSLIMVAYRDRSEHEIRDISYVTKSVSGGSWSVPKLVHADNWEINGCPVNGPALASSPQGDIAVVWYTASGDRARILFARYDTETDAFGPPITLDDQDPPGRLNLQLAADGTAYALGLTATEQADSSALTLWTIPPTNQVQREELAITSAARSSGFPRLALYQDRLHWARTVVGTEKGKQYVKVCSQPR